ncbi:MAG: ABC transporter substrate-binding protein [Burkholderiaceae bacterium]
MLSAAPCLRAQPAGAARRRVGILAPSSAAKEQVTLAPFFEEMRKLGWVEGANISYDRAYADDRLDRLSHIAADLVARAPELIYAPPATAAVAAHAATRSIPIVFGTGVNPVGMGLVASLARPGGNVTGISSIAGSLAPKRLQLLREVLPQARRIGFIGDPSDPTVRLEYAALEALNPAMNLTLVRADAASAADFDVAMRRLLAQPLDVVITEGSFTYNMRERLVELALDKRVPVVGHRSQMADAGALFGYGASLADQLRRSALLVDKVLRGARPGELAVEQPSVFELVVNSRTARMLGIATGQTFLLRADRVIE